MKKLLILSCALAFCLTLAACHTTDSADSSVPSGIPGSAIANESSAHQTESESSLEESQTSQERPLCRNSSAAFRYNASLQHQSRNEEGINDFVSPRFVCADSGRLF